MADTSITYNVFAKFHGDESRMRKFGAAAAAVGVAVGALAVKFGVDSVHAYVDAQQSQDKLAFALQKFPALADTNIDRLGKLNTALAQKTKFDDDATASGQAVLAQFVDNGKQLETLTPLLLDFAAKTGKDLPTAAASMGKAFLGNTRALKELGINYKMTGDATTDMANITQLMREKVGGFASQEGKTAAGQAEILRNQFGELEESLGSKLVPVLTKLATILLSVIGFIQHNSAVIGPLVAVLGTLAVVVGTILAVSRVWIAVQTALNIVLTANPIGLVVVAVALLVAGIILAYKHSETFRNIVQGAFHAVAAAGQFLWGAIQSAFGFIKGAFDNVAAGGRALWNILKAAFGFIVNAWLTVAGAIVHGAETAFGWIPGIGGKLHAAADSFDAFRARVNASLGLIHDKDVTVTVRLVQIGQGTLANKRIPAFAGGVQNFGGGMAWVGEHGPELVTLPKGSDVFSSAASQQMMASPSAVGGGGGPIVVSVQVDSREIARAIARPVRDELDNMTQRRGGSTLAPKR